MSRVLERKALMDHVQGIWLPEYGVLAYPNRVFKTPANSPWAAVNIVDLGSFRESLGREYLKRNLGSLQFDLYTPAGTGSRSIREIADVLEDHFESLQLPTDDGEWIIFGTTTSRDVGGAAERQDGTNENWLRRVVDCEFRRDSIVRK